MLEYLANRVLPKDEACGVCDEVKDPRTLSWVVDDWLCANCRAIQKHSLATEIQLVAASKQQDKSKEL